MSLTPLNEDLDIIQSLVIPSIEDDLDIIQKLDDEPNDVGGLTAAELKAKFDEAGNTIKTYLNDTLVPQLSDTVAEAEERAKAEAERIANEESRATAELAREEAEKARVAAEDIRVATENERISAEEARKAAEVSRVLEEQARVDRDTGIVAQATEQADLAANSEKAAAQSVLDAQAEVQNAKDEVENAKTEVQNAQGKVEDAEAWARGTRNGEAVPDTDPAYQNNSKYWAENAKEIVGPTVTPTQLDAVVAEINQSISDTNTAIDETNAALEKVSSGSTSVPIPNALAQKMGLTTPATVNDALSVLGDVGNIHVWKREMFEGSYLLGTVTNGSLISGSNSTYVFYYSDSISVDKDANVSLVSPVQTVSFNYDSYSNAETLKGKFMYRNSGASDVIGGVNTEITFVPTSATLARSTSGTNYFVTIDYQTVTGVSEAGVTDYPTSTDRNAFGEGYQDYQPAGYTLGAAGKVYLYSNSSNNASISGTIYYGDENSVVVESSGEVSTDTANFAGSVLVGYSANYNENALKGKFIRAFAVSDFGQEQGVWYIPSDAVATRTTEISTDGTKYVVYFSNAQPVIGYPETGSGYLTYLGALGDKARIEVGSYVGTGTYGSENPNTLTFGFAPKVFKVLFYYSNTNLAKANWNGSETAVAFFEALSTSYQDYTGPNVTISYSGSWGKKSADGKTLSFYSTRDATDQLNASGYTYVYIAIG